VFSGDGKVADVLARHRIEDLFVDKEPTSGDRRYWLARCPFHADNNPSFWIDTKEQKGGCFAGCIDKSVDVINVYAQMHGLSNQEALHLLASC
jgi:DNA primase